MTVTTETADEAAAAEPANAEPATYRFFKAGSADIMEQAQHRGTQRPDYVPNAAIVQGMTRMGQAGMGNGAVARVLYSSDSMHISYAWFKSDFPLPLHSHDADCFYQILGGSMKVGTEELRQGDGVMIPGGAPYTVTPGPEGCEFLEIRPTQDYDTRYRGRTEKYWDRLVDIVTSKQDSWSREKPPLDLLGLG